MMRTQLATRATALDAEQIAQLCRGRVVAPGGAAGRFTTDSRSMSPGDCFVALSGDRFDGHEFVRDALSHGAAGVVVSRAVPRSNIPAGSFVVRVPDTLEALQSLAAQCRESHAAKVIGITGSCGKTTTKDMLGHVLAQAMPTVRSPHSYNNAIGVPLTLFLLEPETRAAVVEIGCNEPGEIARLGAIACPDIAIVTCVAEAHLEGLGSIGGVAREKATLVQSLRRGGTAILNGDDRACREMASLAAGRALMVRLDAEADWFATDAHFNGMGTTFLLQGERPVTLPMLGTHSVYNALFTIAAAVEMGMELDTVLESLSGLPPTRRRLEPKIVGDVTIFDDTYNMNPASARAGLRALSGMHCAERRVVVFGEMRELGERSQELHRELGREVPVCGVDRLVTVGEGAAAIAEGARAAGMSKRQIVMTPDPGAALGRLKRIVSPGDCLLCKASRLVGLERLVDGLIDWLRCRPSRARASSA